MESNADKLTILEGVLNNIFECLSDKDESVQNAVEQSLNRIMQKNPTDTLNLMIDFKTKHPKLSEQSISILLRVLNTVTAVKINNLNDDDLNKIISIAVSELTKTNSHCPQIQQPALEVLVTVGRAKCGEVMEQLVSHTKEGQVSHFMILHCMGTLATTNVSGTIPYIKMILSKILPNLGSIKQDHVKQAHTFAIGRFSEALLENSPMYDVLEQNVDCCASEISVAYDVFLNQWLLSREPKVCADILVALSSMYLLIPSEKVYEQSSKIFTTILNLYRRSIDRNAITQFLCSVVKRNLKIDPKSLDIISETLISTLFDLICVYPVYEKPQTVKGHYEVLRCFDLLASAYSNKITDIILMQLKNNNERERIKALLILTHLTNTSVEIIQIKLTAFIEALKHMILTEKPVKIKMTLLKTIVALAQKSFINDKEFIWFIIRHSCRYKKSNNEYGTIDEYNELMQSSQNSLNMLSSTVGTMDNLLKNELLNYFLLLDFTDISGTIAKCLCSLFSKSVEIELEINNSLKDEGYSKTSKLFIPSPEAVFARCIALLGNCQDKERIKNLLLFLKAYSVVIHPDLKELWDYKIPELILCNGREKLFLDHLGGFITQTLDMLSKDNDFSKNFVKQMADQLILYPMNLPHSEFQISQLNIERGMLLKAIGLCLCYLSDNEIIESNIDLIINIAKQEKIDKYGTNSEYEHKLTDAAKALGFASKSHYFLVIKHISELVQSGTRKQSPGFFSNFNFLKDTNKDHENYKSLLLVFESFGYIIPNANPSESLKDVDNIMINILLKNLFGTKDKTMKKIIIQSLFSICNQFSKNKDLGYELTTINDILKAILSIPMDDIDNLPLFSEILRIATILIKLETNENIEINDFFYSATQNFFLCATNLKTKFNSQEEDDFISFIAFHLNQVLPELNAFVKVIIENNPTPSCLDEIVTILECWLKHENSEVRICAGRVMINSLDAYIKSAKIGYEAPSKFNQTGHMLGRIVPRCIDSNATVRQNSIDIVKKILELACIYDTLTIADSTTTWMKDLEKIREDIATDSSIEIYQIAGEIAKIIALRLSSFQYSHFCKSLLHSLNDPEQSSSIGASVVLKYFIQHVGAELFHAIPELVKESLDAIKSCDIERTKAGVLKALVALTKHHPKLVCNEMLAQLIPYDKCVIDYWKSIKIDLELTGVIIDNFLATLSTSCLYESQENKDDRQMIASLQPFAIFCALREIFSCSEIKSELQFKFSEIFAMLLTTLATFTNLAPPMIATKSLVSTKGQSINGKSKFGFIPNKDIVKMNPCQIVLESLIAFLTNLEMKELCNVFSNSNHLATSSDLSSFIELLTPMAIALSNEFSINSNTSKQIVTTFSKYVTSPYEGHRISAVGMLSQLVPLKPCGEISSVIMLHLNSALNDPNPIVRGLCIRGLAFVGNLNENDIRKHAESVLTSLLKGIDDSNSECLINIPLESLKGLSRVLQTLPCEHVESFHISLAIRIRPFFENPSNSIREAAIILFGDLCESKIVEITDGNITPNGSSEALKEQLFSNLISLILHLSESEQTIVKACKITLRKMCNLINAEKCNEMAQKHLIDYGQLNYDIFIVDFIKLIAAEITERIQDFIESCIPFLKSHWDEIRGNAAIIIGILHNFLKINSQSSEVVGHKIAFLLKDDSSLVRLKAATALGYFFGSI